jgi:ABC-2 type transport system permease protein
MLAAGLVALATAAVYMAGMRSYMDGVTRGFAGEGASAQAAAASRAVMEQLGLTFSANDYVMLGLSLFAAILVALSMAIILGAFAESVKAVQALLTPLMVLLLVPYFLTLFFDLSQLPTTVRWIVSAIPFTYPFLAGPGLFFDNYQAVWFGIGYQLAWFVVLAIVAARIFSSDRILTMKLSFGRKRGAPKT